MCGPVVPGLTQVNHNMFYAITAYIYYITYHTGIYAFVYVYSDSVIELAMDLCIVISMVHRS